MKRSKYTKMHSFFEKKLAAEAEGKSWTPSLSKAAATPVAAASPNRAATAATRSLGNQRSNSSSGRNSPAFGDTAGGLVSDKERNETYFATLGQANVNRDA